MKKKTIEKIPYLGLKKISRIKSVKYIGVTAVKNIGHQRHLFLEVYENKKESKKIPVVRIALTKKDFGTYWPDKNIWTRQQVSYYRPIWMKIHTGGTLTDENILQSPEDLERIKNFCGTKLFDASWWWENISRYEADITSTERINRVEREHKRRQEALKDRQANTKALPEKAILYRADHAYFHDEHFLYYKKHGSRADIACSKCGGVTTARWKSSGAYEDQFERKNVLQAPIEVTEGTNSIALEFDIKDYTIPGTAAAVVYSMCTRTMAEPNKALAEVDGNTITIIPSESFFHAGQNVMQIRVIDGDSKLISFNIIVKCTGKMRFGDEEEEKQTTLVEQLLKRFGNYEAELKDVRKGFAGESYDTAGEAVRKQIESVNQKVDKIETISTKEIDAI